MRLNQLDAITMGRLMADLCAAHGKPFGDLAEAQVKVYHESLSDCTVDEVEQAVKTACRDFDRFPKPKHLRALIASRRPHRPSSADHGDPSAFCSTCNTAYQWRRLAHWIKGAQDLQCDCSWRMIVRMYATDEDLEAMGTDDPFATDEARRRIAIQRKAAA